MRKLIVGLGISLLTVVAVDARAASSKKPVQKAQVSKKLAGAKATKPPVQLFPGQAGHEEKFDRDVFSAVLLAVFPDSVVVERELDPAVIAAWLRQGTLPNGVTQLAAIQDMVLIEDRVLERIYFDSETVDPVASIQPHLLDSVLVTSRADITGRRYLDQIKP